MDRRSFLKGIGAAGGAALCARDLQAAEQKSQREFDGVLVDTTMCVGCRTCEESCAEAHGLPDPEIDDDSVQKVERKTTASQWTVNNRYETSRGEVFAKKQCMHCNQPACASACLVKAMYKTESGPVIWRGEKCMGCRYCMISCPFDMPKFEFDSPNPKIQKCVMCWERLQQGERPACVENCPMEAIIFGKRRDLLSVARQRIAENPDKYVDHIFGEHEVGGTGYLYLSAVPFEEIGFRTDLGNRAYPELTKGFLYSVPLVFTIVPPLLLALSKARERSTTNES